MSIFFFIVCPPKPTLEFATVIVACGVALLVIWLTRRRRTQPVPSGEA